MKSYLRAKTEDLDLPALFIQKPGTKAQAIVLVSRNPKFSAPAPSVPPLVPPMPGMAPQPMYLVVVLVDDANPQNVGTITDRHSLADLQAFRGSVVLENE